MPAATATREITVPIDKIAVRPLRLAVKSEMEADATSFGRNSHEEVDEAIGLFRLHSTLLDQVGWQDGEGGRLPGKVRGEPSYLKRMVESAMSPLSDHIAGAVGEYRKDEDPPVDLDLVAGHIAQLQVLIELHRQISEAAA